MARRKNATGVDAPRGEKRIADADAYRGSVSDLDPHL
jgi:hypothetical protein